MKKQYSKPTMTEYHVTCEHPLAVSGGDEVKHASTGVGIGYGGAGSGEAASRGGWDDDDE